MPARIAPGYSRPFGDSIGAQASSRAGSATPSRVAALASATR